jgi:Mrp family chromosome partitioning ATPase
MIVASQADGVLLVLNAQKTSKASVRKSRRSLEAVGASLLGTVMNNAKDGKSSSYGSVYGR